MLEKEKLTFHPISLQDRDWINEKLREEDLGACEYTFANNFVWASAYDVQVGMVYGCGVIRYREKEEFEYSFPFGDGDKKAAIELLKGICAAHGHGLRLYPVLEEGRRRLIEWFPGSFEISADRADSDYIYTVEKLSTLRGKKLHAKRNHIARFMDDDDWRYERMTKDDMDECRKMAKEWTSLRSDKWNDEMEREIHVLEVAFSHFDELELVGGILYKNEKMVAFTIGERLNSDTFVVHFEKAYPDLQGAYPMINQQFVLHEAQGYAYVDREEDTGDLGLRKAKLSYQPDILLKKYHAVESRVVFANEWDKEDIIHIWQACFGDDRPYIEFYLKERFDDQNMLVIHEDGHPVSMASFLPVQIARDGGREQARYVYAVATLPQYRKKGYAAKILRHAAERYKEPLILQPEDDRLHGYYQRLGFIEGFAESPCWVYNGKDSSDRYAPEIFSAGCMEELSALGAWRVSDVDGKTYQAIRDQYLEQEGYVAWDADALAYAIKENAFCHGRTLLLTKEEDPDSRAVLMYRLEQDRLRVIETTLEDDALQAVLPELLAHTRKAQAYARNMGGMILVPPGSASWYGREGYLGLTLA